MLLDVRATVIEGGGRAACVEYSHYCSRACFMKMVEFEESTELRFISLNSRWLGGGGFRTLEERMEEALERLPISSELLAFLLIEMLRDFDRDEKQIHSRH
jgi:hypothetical protein